MSENETACASTRRVVKNAQRSQLQLQLFSLCSTVSMALCRFLQPRSSLPSPKGPLSTVISTCRVCMPLIHKRVHVCTRAKPESQKLNS